MIKIMAEGGGLKQIEDVLYAPRHLEFVIIPDWKFQIEFSSIGFVLNTNGRTVVAKGAHVDRIHTSITKNPCIEKCTNFVTECQGMSNLV